MSRQTVSSRREEDSIEASRGVHRMNAPWLAAGKKKKKTPLEIGFSAREDRAVSSKRKPSQKQIRSALCNARNSVATTVEPPSYPMSSALQPPTRTIPAINNYEEPTLSEGHKSGSSSFAPSDETHSSDDSLNERVSRTPASTSVPPKNYTKQMAYRKQYLEDQNLEFRTTGNQMHDVDFPQVTPRRRNTSPARLRRQEKPKDQKYEYKRYVTPPTDKETRMAHEMKKDLERMSMQCGAMSGDLRRSVTAISKGPQKPKSAAGFSILPSSMSCLNPITQVDAVESAGRDIHAPNLQWMKPGTARSEATDKKPFCKGVSSALLCDIRDDDELWKYYEDEEFVSQSSFPKKNGLEIESRVSSLSQNSRYEEEREESYKIDREPRDSYGRDKYDQFEQHGVLKKNMISNATSTYENGRHSARYILERDQSENHYESLMKYPAKQRYEQEEFQPSKEELLNQMRQAVEKASVQLKIARTMETEYSDESSYISNRSKQKHSFPQDFERTTSDGYKKYQISTDMRGDKYAFI